MAKDSSRSKADKVSQAKDKAKAAKQREEAKAAKQREKAKAAKQREKAGRGDRESAAVTANVDVEQVGVEAAGVDQEAVADGQAAQVVVEAEDADAVAAAADTADTADTADSADEDSDADGDAAPPARRARRSRSRRSAPLVEPVEDNDKRIRPFGYIAEALGKEDAVTRSTQRETLAASYTTREHDIIRAWAESRGGRPADVNGTGRPGRPAGVLRIEFPDGPGDDSRLDEVDWDSYFQTFDDSNVDFLYQERLRTGDISRFHKIVRADA